MLVCNRSRSRSRVVIRAVVVALAAGSMLGLGACAPSSRIVGEEEAVLTSPPNVPPPLTRRNPTKAIDENPPYVVFNGSVGALAGENALKAEVGETVRLFVGNGGPNLISSFHVIGEIFDRVYTRTCAACHQPTGLGIPNVFPPLAGSDYLNANATRAIGAVLNGLSGPITVNGAAYNSVMPGLALSDDDVANVLTYVYSQWGNKGTLVTPAQVKAVRSAGGTKANADAH